MATASLGGERRALFTQLTQQHAHVASTTAVTSYSYVFSGTVQCAGPTRAHRRSHQIPLSLCQRQPLPHQAGQVEEQAVEHIRRAIGTGVIQLMRDLTLCVARTVLVLKSSTPPSPSNPVRRCSGSATPSWKTITVGNTRTASFCTKNGAFSALILMNCEVRQQDGLCGKYASSCCSHLLAPLEAAALALLPLTATDHP